MTVEPPHWFKGEKGSRVQSPHERVTVITDCTAEEPLGPEDLRRRTVRGDVESGNLPGNVEKASLIQAGF